MKIKHTIAAPLAIAAAILPVNFAHAEQKVTFSDDFSSYAATSCPSYVDGDTFGQWKVEFTGYGCVRIANINGNNVLEMQPQAVADPNSTSAPLVVGPTVSAPFTYKGSISTLRQLRQNSAPNSWETAWIVWNYTDNTHFYYFIPKENGWELGKEDPAYPGAQRFLATGTTPTYSLSEIKNFEIQQTGNTMIVYINGEKIVEFTDNERPYTSGRIGIYSEDAAIIADNISIATEVTPTTPANPAAPNSPSPASPTTGNPAQNSTTPSPTPNSSESDNNNSLAPTGGNLAAVIASGFSALIAGLFKLFRG